MRGKAKMAGGRDREGQERACSKSESYRLSQIRYWKKLKSDPIRLAAYNAKKRQQGKKNAEAQRASHRKWIKNNRHHVNEYRKRLRLEFPEIEKQRDRARYKKRRARILAGQKKARADAMKGPIIRARVAAKRLKKKLANPERARIDRRAYREANIVAYRIAELKKTAKIAGLAFDLDKEWLRDRMEAGLCEMSGMPFAFEEKRGPFSPSVDRIDPAGSYTKTNCRLIIWWLNRAMSNWGEEMALEIFRSVLAKRSEL